MKLDKQNITDLLLRYPTIFHKISTLTSPKSFYIANSIASVLRVRQYWSQIKSSFMQIRNVDKHVKVNYNIWDFGVSQSRYIFRPKIRHVSS